MRKSHDQVRGYMSKIRRLMIIDSDMSAVEMQRQLEENGLHLDREYIGRLRDKIWRERSQKLNYHTLQKALSMFIDAMGENARMSWEIALSNISTRKEKLMALREIRAAHRDAFDKLFESGVFERQLGRLKTDNTTLQMLLEIKRDAEPTRQPEAKDGGALAKPE